MNEQANDPLEANEINFHRFGVAEARGLRDTVEGKHSALSLTCGFGVDGGVGVSVTV